MMATAKTRTTPTAPAEPTRLSVDKAWFEDLFRTNQISARQLAKKMEVDPSALSLILSGQRRLKNDEAAAMALHLNVSLADVLSHAGVNMAGVARPTISVPTPSGRVVKLEIPPGLTPKDWELAAAYVGQLVAAKVSSDKGSKG